MKSDFIKTRIVYVARVLLILTAVLAGIMVAKVNAFVSDADSIPKRIQKAMSPGSDDAESLKKLKALYTEAANILKKKSIFSPPPPEKTNPVSIIDAVLGNEALINGNFYKAGDKIGDAEILSVSPKSVIISWNGKESNIHPFTHTAKLPETKSEPKTTPSKPSEPKQTVVEEEPKPKRPSEGRTEFSGLSEEEVRRLVAERRANGRSDERDGGERRSRDGERSGSSRGSSGRGSSSRRGSRSW